MWAKMSLKHVQLKEKKKKEKHINWTPGTARKPTNTKNLILSKVRMLPLVVQSSSALTHS